MSPSAPDHQLIAALQDRIAALLALDDETFWSRRELCSESLILPLLLVQRTQ